MKNRIQRDSNERAIFISIRDEVANVGKRMKYQKLLWMSLCLAAVNTAFAGPVPKEIKSRYAQLHTVIRTLNFDQFKGFFADDFVNIDPAGKSANRSEFLAGVKPLFDANKSGTVSEKLISANKHDSMVDVATDLLVKLKGSTGTTVIHEVCTDTWKMVGKQWVMVKTVDSKFDVTMPKPKKGKGK